MGIDIVAIEKGLPSTVDRKFNSTQDRNTKRITVEFFDSSNTVFYCAIETGTSKGKYFSYFVKPDNLKRIPDNSKADSIYATEAEFVRAIKKHAAELSFIAETV